MFDRGLKKRQKLALLRRQIGPLEPHHRALLVTCGDNNGALDWHLREGGGRWTWVELEADKIPEVEALLGEPVLRGTPDALPVEPDGFDLVVSVDVHEHLDEPERFTRQLARAAAPGGRVVVTTPDGRGDRLVPRLKRLLGMTPATYGHRVEGVTVAEHEGMLRAAGLEPVAVGSYSRLFTELIELAINFAYVKVLGKGSGEDDGREGEIAPQSEETLAEVGAAYRLYSVFFPLLRAVAALDRLVPGAGHAVSVVARRPGSAAEPR